MWRMDESGGKLFAGGQEDWTAAAREADNCGSFRADEEDEQTAEQARSCYNCRYRRWTAASFTCMAG
ncbi:hypothetical protein DESUT3_03180 [Desulfuromonas versatilis]|uniref:Uncharacterized protein n=1 Tax=Desulfuromonas versatilis TaxID=2802975 RepID=A0ABM8HS17_9BACT|nr:hypothetical protein [Desulfuromonas versatilis]BCR03249.1 hypothetical protein DESUT3_03180 [Desulfuromonas versatilis]